jgi:hypothetical protein
MVSRPFSGLPPRGGVSRPKRTEPGGEATSYRRGADDRLVVRSRDARAGNAPRGSTAVARPGVASVGTERDPERADIRHRSRKRRHDACQQTDARLLVIGGRNHGKIIAVLLGSMARGILQHVTCPTAIVY